MDQSFGMVSSVVPFLDDDLELIELTEADIFEEGEPDRLVERVRPVYQAVEDNPWDVVADEPEPEPSAFEQPADLGAPVEADEPAVEVAPAKDPLMTSTLAELYVSQGFTDKALDIYRALLVSSPGSESIVARIAELEKQQESPPVEAHKAYEEAGLSADSAAKIEVLEGWLENIRRLKECR